MTSTSTLAELAVTHPAAARVFYRHGLDFCCGGGRPLAAACAARGINPDVVIQAIDEEEQGAGDRRWDLAPLGELINFIVATYHQRLRDSFPDFIRMADRVESRHADKGSCPNGLAAHLRAMHSAVLEHLDKEELVLFPLILNGQGRLAIGPVHVMEREHDEHARNLGVLRSLTNDLEAPAEACPTWQALYLALRQLEEDLMVHIHLENNVLFRRALAE